MRSNRRALSLVLVTLVLVVAGNVVASRSDAQVDVSAGRRFTLTPGSRGLARAVDAPLRITAFTNPDGPAGRDARFLLSRYRELNGKIRTRIVDPDEKPSEARRFGIARFATVVLQYRGRRVDASLVEEAEISTGILRLLRGRTTTACYLTGHGEPDLEDTSPDGASKLADLLERNAYEGVALDLVATPTVPDRCRLVLAVGPRVPLASEEAKALEDYVRKAGRLAYLATPLSTANPNAILRPWGIGFLGGLAVDPARSQDLDLSNLVVEEFPSENPVVDGVPRLRLPVSGGLGLEGSPRAGLTLSRLAVTSGAGYVESTPDEALEPGPGDVAGPVVVAAAADDSRVEPGADPRAPDVRERVVRTRVFATGSAEWVRNRFLDELGNRKFILNALAWLSQEEQVLAIGADPDLERPLPFTAERQTRVLLVTVGLVPGGAIALGVLQGVLARRGRRRR